MKYLTSEMIEKTTNRIPFMDREVEAALQVVKTRNKMGSDLVIGDGKFMDGSNVLQEARLGSIG